MNYLTGDDSPQPPPSTGELLVAYLTALDASEQAFDAAAVARVLAVAEVGERAVQDAERRHARPRPLRPPDWPPHAGYQPHGSQLLETGAR